MVGRPGTAKKFYELKKRDGKWRGRLKNKRSCERRRSRCSWIR